MGVLLDSSAVIVSERAGDTEQMMLRRLGLVIPDQDLALSSIGVAEILHGIYRAKDPAIRARREMFLSHLLEDVLVYGFSPETAKLAGRIGGEQAALGFTIPFVDLLIGATALEQWLLHSHDHPPPLPPHPRPRSHSLLTPTPPSSYSAPSP